ncbi:MAG: GTP-binding protein [Candidatus Korarchaeum sp.]
MKVNIIGGFLGSGKTSTIISLSKKLYKEFGKKIAVIVNEIGEVPVDSKIIQEYGLKTRELGGGCICCELNSDLHSVLQQLYHLFKPDLVFLEPTGIALPKQIKDAVLFLRNKIPEVGVGYYVAIFDALRSEELLQEDLIEDLDYIVVRQLKEADVIAINKVDLVDEDSIRWCEGKLKEINPEALLIRLSTVRGDGLPELMKLISPDAAD